ncbi:MAG: DMT family transporter [Acidimicrobiaceae bacterium]|nr:DMT family transporter [Acidimicrobiaceae bacterium]MCO5331385.1 DMT family transporter [Ilumatobacteraceae bacterium]
MPILLSLASAVVYGVGDWFGGRAARRQSAIVVAGVGQVVSLILVFVGVLIIGSPVPSAATWVWGAGAGMVGALGIAGLYHGFANGDVTVVAPLSAVVGTVVPVAGALIIGERPSGLAYAGIALAVVAIALVSGALGTHSHNTPPRIVALAIGVGACFGLLFIALERTDANSGMWPLVAARLASVPMLLVLALGSGARPVAHRASIVTSMGVGVVDMAANVLYLEAVRRGELSIVSVVASLYPASTVALAFGVDRERIGRWQALGLALAVAALVMVSLSRS